MRSFSVIAWTERDRYIERQTHEQTAIKEQYLLCQQVNNSVEKLKRENAGKQCDKKT